MYSLFTRIICTIAVLGGFCFTGFSQSVNVDTLAYQDFEITPATPTWTYTGVPNDFQTGLSPSTANPPNSPLGIDSSRAWHVRSVSGGNALTFDNQTIPSGYDSIRVNFKLAAMNLNGSGGGPDNLDYVLVAYSLNNGQTFSNRIRVRGATTNQSTWAYSATAIANAFYLPANEVVFQPTTSGLQTTFGYSTVELVFPGSITQLSIRITPRSSSSSDSWLVDDLTLTGENSCTPTTSSITVSECESYTAPSGAVFTTSGTFSDTIPNAIGCDSIIAINLTVNNNSFDTLTLSACGSYTSPTGIVWDSTGIYMDTISNAANCDSILMFDLTINTVTSDSVMATTCDTYTTPSGAVLSQTGSYLDTIPNAAGCDSVIAIDLTVITVNNAVTQSGNTLTASATGATYQWISCDSGMTLPSDTNATFNPTTSGNYAVIVDEGGCVDTSACTAVVIVGLEHGLAQQVNLWPNPVEGQLHLDLGTGIDAFDVSIYDAQGRLVNQWEQVNGHLQISTQELSPGVYYIQFEGEDQSTWKKFLKQ